MSQIEPETMPDFSGKIVIFYLAAMGPETWGGSGIALNYINPRVVGGRVILEGRLAEAVGEPWAWGLHAGVAWDSVAHYLVFDSLDEYKQRAPVATPGVWQRIKNLAG